MSDPVTLKYIRHSVAGFIVWPKLIECVSHKDMARALQFSKEVAHGHLLSAGFIDFNGGNSKPFCYGRSESLNLNSMAADTAALREQWGMRSIGAPAAPLPPSLQAQAQAVGAGGDADSLEPSEPVL